MTRRNCTPNFMHKKNTKVTRRTKIWNTYKNFQFSKKWIDYHKLLVIVKACPVETVMQISYIFDKNLKSYEANCKIWNKKILKIFKKK